jgi:SAM-dependent methyltransferase
LAEPIESIESFYDDLAGHYNLLFEDWNRSITRQASVLGPILERYTGKSSPRVLDCACGIGTQAIGLAQRGHSVSGSDLSARAIDRARAEAQKRNLPIDFHVADLRQLSAFPEGSSENKFDAILVADNALPHLLTQDDLQQALSAIASRLSGNGILVATIRDYDALLLTRPTFQPPAFFPHPSSNPAAQRIVHQVWQWHGDEYDLHLYLTLPVNDRQDSWQVRHFHSRYRALTRAELNLALNEAGFTEITWLEPAATSFYQPIVVARRKTTVASLQCPLSQPAASPFPGPGQALT